MHIGMLWYDPAPGQSLKSRIEKAADYYRRKYHREPNLCLIHPSMLDAQAKQGKIEPQVPNIDNMTIRPYVPVLPGHLWIGVEDGN